MTIDQLRDLTLVTVILAAIPTNLFVIIYAFKPWRTSWLGIHLMLRSVTLAFALDLTTFLRFKVVTNYYILSGIAMAIYLIIAITSFYMVYILIKLGFHHPKEK